MAKGDIFFLASRIWRQLFLPGPTRLFPASHGAWAGISGNPQEPPSESFSESKCGNKKQQTEKRSTSQMFAILLSWKWHVNYLLKVYHLFVGKEIVWESSKEVTGFPSSRQQAKGSSRSYMEQKSSPLCGSGISILICVVSSGCVFSVFRLQIEQGFDGFWILPTWFSVDNRYCTSKTEEKNPLKQTSGGHLLPLVAICDEGQSCILAGRHWTWTGSPK